MALRGARRSVQSVARRGAPARALGTTGATLRPAVRGLPGIPPPLSEVLGTAQVGTEVTVTGWIRQLRRQKRVAFASLGDGSSNRQLQLVFGDPSICPADVGNGASVRVTGVVQPSPRNPQQLELHVEAAAAVEVLGGCPPDVYPLATKRHSLEFLREKPHLRPRTNTIGAVMRVRSGLTSALHDYFRQHAFFNVHTPIVTTNDCEGAGETFAVSAPAFEAARGTTAENRTQQADESTAHFFGGPAHLTVSGQLHAEAMATALSRVYTFGPTFRAENSNTPRHLAEFYMLEAEVAFGGLDAAVALAEGCVRHCATELLADPVLIGDLEQLWAHAEREAAGGGHNGRNQGRGGDSTTAASCRDRVETAREPFARMTYTEAVDELQGASTDFRFPVVWGSDLKFEHEQWLARVLHGRPLVVTDYPSAIKPFYMRRNQGGETVACFDVLVPGIGELVGGSAREERLDVLDAAVPPEARESLDWYLDLRRFGTVPHAGFGLGFERLIQYFTGLANIRDAIPFPRHVGTCRL